MWRVVQQYVQQHNIPILSWPVVSQGLSPSEPVWDEMKRRRRDLPDPPPQHAAIGQGTDCDLEQPPAAVHGMATKFNEATNPPACIQAGCGTPATREKATMCTLRNRNFVLCLILLKNEL